jgi:hypothetical protein
MTTKSSTYKHPLWSQGKFEVDAGNTAPLIVSHNMYTQAKEELTTIFQLEIVDTHEPTKALQAWYKLQRVEQYEILHCISPSATFHHAYSEWFNCRFPPETEWNKLLKFFRRVFWHNEKYC